MEPTPAQRLEDYRAEWSLCQDCGCDLGVESEGHYCVEGWREVVLPGSCQKCSGIEFTASMVEQEIIYICDACAHAEHYPLHEKD